MIPAGQRLPLTLLTGFLGSGKTTVLSRLIRTPGLEKTACVINEFGDVGLDHWLVERSDETTVLLEGGCLCCTVRGDLVDTLRRLFLQRVRGEVPPFERVVIETTGLADPAPILHTLISEPLLAARYRLDGIVTTVDAVLGESQLEQNPESVKQAALADRLVLTKTDLASPAAIARLEARLQALNPGASRLIAVAGTPSGDASWHALLGAGLYDPETGTLNGSRWLKAEAYPAPACADGTCHHREHAHAPPGSSPASSHNHPHTPANAPPLAHDGIRSFCLTFATPLPWEPFALAMESLTTLHGANILRIKGILWVAGEESPVAIHGVQHLFYPPATLDRWPDDARLSQIVFITRDLEPAVVTRFLALSV